MADLFDNPMGLMGFEFVEFASPTPNVLEPLFEKLGFSLVARHRSKDVVLYRQGDINFIVNREPRSLAGYFAAEHGPSACALAFRVRDSHKAYARALELGGAFLPADADARTRSVRFFELDKALYELEYEIQNRPSWLHIPAAGILRLTGEAGS